jgi:uncharacterized protein (TIRG00374 family)
MSRSRVRNHILLVIKVGLACLLLWWLARQAQQGDSFLKLRNQPKNWGLLALATLACLASIVITFYRWMLLVRALKISFSASDAFRLGFQSYALNFVSLGSVGGDLFKAVFIAREQPDRRAEAIATVVIDRLVGLYALFLVSTGAIVFAWWRDAPWLKVHEVQVIARSTIACTIVGGILCLILALPNFTRGRVGRAVERLPVMGPTLVRLLEAIHLYRTQRWVMAYSLFISLFVQLLVSLSVWLVAKGLPGKSLTLGENILAVPLAGLVGALPITPSGLGAFEGVLEFLYQKIGAPGTIDPGQGFVVALAFRVITMIVALPGIYYIVRGRRTVAAMMHEAEEEKEAEDKASNRAT